MNELSEFYSIQKLTIIDYFDKLINQIDIATETLISEFNSNESSKEEINNLRFQFLEEIKRVQTFNLKNFEEIFHNEFIKIRKKLLNSKNSNEVACCAGIDIKNNIFKLCCIFIENCCLNNVFTSKYGLLVTLDWFMNENDVNLIK